MATLEPKPWQGRVYRHLPVDTHLAPLAPNFAAHSRENRWNLPGEPTMTFTSDRALLADEFRHHIQCDRDAELLPLVRTRRVIAIELRLDRVFDLTDPAVVDELRIPNAPGCFADQALARATAGFLRHARNAEGVVVPSLLHLDDPERWLLTVFLDGLTRPLDEIALSVETIGIFEIGTGTV